MPRVFSADGEDLMRFLAGAFPCLQQVTGQVQQRHPFSFEHLYVETERLGAGGHGDAIIKHQS